MYAAYRRVSRVGERDERLRSPEYQANRIMDAARREGVEVEMLDPELDVSGSKESRRILDAALTRIDAGELEGLVVAKLDRLSRMSLRKALTILDRIESAGGRVISAAEPLDASTPEGRFARNTFLNASEMEGGVKAAGFEVSKAGAIAAGMWTAPRVPLGYTKDPATRSLVPNAEAPVVAHAFEMRAAGDSWGAIVHYMTDEIGRRIEPRRVQKMVANDAYLGTSRQGKHVNANAHPAIVDRGLFEAAQRPAPRPARSGKAPQLCSGLGRCATCGRRLTAHGGVRASYICSGRLHCPAPAQIVAHSLDVIVEKRVIPALAGLTAEAQRRTNDLDAALVDLADTERVRDEYNSPEVQGAMKLSTWLAGLRDREQLVEEASVRVGRARSAAPNLPLPSELESAWPSMPLEERRAILRGAVGCIYVEPGNSRYSDAASRVVVLASGFDPGPVPLPDSPSGVLS